MSSSRGHGDGSELSCGSRRALVALCFFHLTATGCALSAASFRAAVNVSSNAENSLLPSLVVSESGPTLGQAHVFWHDYSSAPNRLWCALDPGDGWLMGSECTPNVNRAWSPRAVIDGRGFIHLVWRDRATADDIHYALFDGSWSVPVKLWFMV